MARVKSLDQITGSLKNLSFYTRKGSDQIFVRTKGGASKEKIKRDPAFEGLRKSNKEFGGCSTMSKNLRLAFYGLEHVADFNLSAKFNSLMKSIQNTDTEHPKGERSIVLTRYKNMLDGFQFNTVHPFNTVLRMPLQWEIDRATQSAKVTVPAFACSFGLNAPGNYALFRLRFCLGAVTDMQLNDRKTKYEPVTGEQGYGFQLGETAWYPTQSSVEAQILELQLKDPFMPGTGNDTLLLVAVIEFGTLDAFGNPTAIRKAGAGMILGTK